MYINTIVHKHPRTLMKLKIRMYTIKILLNTSNLKNAINK